MKGSIIMQSNIEIGKRIANLRKNEGLTQTELSKILRVKRETISQWENGDRDLKAGCIIALAQVLNVSTDYLLGLSKVRTSYIGYDLTVFNDENNDSVNYKVFINDNLDTYGCEKNIITNNAADAIFEAIDLFKSDRGNESVPVFKAECFERVAMLDVKKGR